jgi:protein phosphatase
MLEAVALTDIGRKRKLNQDAVYATREKIGNLPNLFVVADGMGGHNGGEMASQWTIETMREQIAKASSLSPTRLLEQAIRAANDEIRRKAEENPLLHGMGTTIVAATIEGKSLQVANVGDSRLYLADRKGKTIRQLTLDHSLVEEMIRCGNLRREEARNHPNKHIITRAVGAKDSIEVDFFHEEIEPDELILLCSDGLTNMLEDEEIKEILCSSGSKDLGQKAAELIAAANNRGGRDNIAVVLVDIGDV